MKEKKGEHPLGDMGQSILLVLFLIVWGGDSFFLHKTTFLAENIPLLIRLIILGIVLIIGIYLSKSGHVVVSHEQHPDQVVSTGSFKYVRHPLYLGSILFYLGLTAATASLIALGLLVIICFFYDYIAGYEEKLLVLKFGEAYHDYQKKTGKWLPRLGRRK